MVCGMRCNHYCIFGRYLLFRAFSASQNSWTLTQGVSLGFHISRLQR